MTDGGVVRRERKKGLAGPYMDATSEDIVNEPNIFELTFLQRLLSGEQEGDNYIFRRKSRKISNLSNSTNLASERVFETAPFERQFSHSSTKVSERRISRETSRSIRHIGEQRSYLSHLSTLTGNLETVPEERPMRLPPMTLPPIYTVKDKPLYPRTFLTPTSIRGPITDDEWLELSACRYIRYGLPKYQVNRSQDLDTEQDEDWLSVLY